MAIRPSPLVALALAGCAHAGPATGEAPAAASFALACSYDSVQANERVTVAGCASIDAAGLLALASAHRARLAYADGFAAVFAGGTWHLVRRDGRSAPVMTMDNGAEPFAEGLVRSPRGAKIGYVDRDLSLVIPARYDGAFPFVQGRAAVCIGCTIRTEGEHASYDGGSWGCIDPSGREVVPLRPLAAGEAGADRCGM